MPLPAVLQKPTVKRPTLTSVNRGRRRLDAPHESVAHIPLHSGPRDGEHMHEHVIVAHVIGESMKHNRLVKRLVEGPPNIRRI
jgi:hypothetical protein